MSETHAQRVRLESSGLLFSYPQVSIFCGRLFGDYFANQVASKQILVAVAPKMVVAWKVVRIPYLTTLVR